MCSTHFLGHELPARRHGPKRTGTPGEYRTLAGGSSDTPGSPAAATASSSSNSSCARCSGHCGCSFGQRTVLRPRPPRRDVCSAHRAVKKCSRCVGLAIASPIPTFVCVRTPRGPGQRRTLSYSALEASTRERLGAQLYGSAAPSRAARTGRARSASRERNTTPRLPAPSTEYSRTFVSMNEPSHGTGGKGPNPSRRIWKWMRPTHEMASGSAGSPSGTSGRTPHGKSGWTRRAGTGQCRKTASAQNWWSSTGRTGSDGDAVIGSAVAKLLPRAIS